jgi:hypothetical protein
MKMHNLDYRVTCPRCGRLHDPLLCPNCGSRNGYKFINYISPPETVRCVNCQRDVGQWPCSCGTWIDIRLLIDKAPGCFIATEIYGVDSAQVATLRNFRDQALLPTQLGGKLVDRYYDLSPTMIRLMRRSRVVRTVAHSAVSLLVFSVRAVFRDEDGGGARKR